MQLYEITPEHWQAAIEVPKQLALDPENTPAQRLRAAKLVQAMIGLVWKYENEREQLRLLALAAEPQDEVIYVREDENFYGNNAHQIVREREAQQRAEAENRAEANAEKSSEPPRRDDFELDPHPTDVKLGTISGPIQADGTRTQTTFIRSSDPWAYRHKNKGTDRTIVRVGPSLRSDSAVTERDETQALE